jgi:MFS family permease
MAESRLGPRSAARIGLGLLALGSLGFAIGSIPSVLIASRFVSAIGAAVAWAGALAWIAHSASARKRGAAFGLAALWGGPGDVRSESSGLSAAACWRFSRFAASLYRSQR